MAKLKLHPQRLMARPQRIQVAKRIDPFYATPEYRAWTARVKAEAGFRCEDPDHPENRPREGRAARLVADHLAPRRQGGDDFGPGMCRCWSCHEKKGAADRAKLARQTF
jgi:hypothetical protein